MATGNSLSRNNVPIITATHFKGDAGLLVEVDLGDDSTSLQLYIKDAATVR